ncbi:hypothetical protein BDP27DRAFT_1342164 [Rhodocollybia butyracea]|uniref:Uncharacterized protein n=1 Tax=Rhodocollybia butyracea TaxID=206335 RepID=A0A9P5P6C1_9AGAR|nr:hypothetical protein BDP27DRAFT_1342164 [Rhodocollybia butyracea]
MAKYLSQRIEGLIWLDKTEISFLKAKIFDAETMIKNFDTDKSDLTLKGRKDELEKLKNILSPIRQVPLDVLSEIFDLSCCIDRHVTSLRCTISAHVCSSQGNRRVYSFEGGGVEEAGADVELSSVFSESSGVSVGLEQESRFRESFRVLRSRIRCPRCSVQA